VVLCRFELGLFEQGEPARTALVVDRARFGERQASRRAVQQPHCEAVLEPSHELAGGDE
jgi:hypothetical protein